MSSSSLAPVRLPKLSRQARVRPRASLGDRMMLSLCAAAGALAVFILAETVYQLISNASPALNAFGLSFVGHSTWEPNLGKFGAAAAIYGTVITSFMALLFAAPLGVAVGLYLSMMAPSAVRSVVGPLVEMLAAIPSVIVGFWGLVALAPFLAGHVEQPLHDVLGFIPLFGTPQPSGLSVFTASAVLTVMILPIVAALSRDLFLTVPRELLDGAAALGATRWEVMRGIVLPATAPGVIAAIVLALGRALGETIAVTQTVGDGFGIHTNVFMPGNTLSSVIATEFQSPVSRLNIPSLFYLALILLALGLMASIGARMIASRFDVHGRLVTA